MGELVFIGLGITEGYLTLKGLEEARRCERVFAEFYTSKAFEKLEKLTGRKIDILQRKDIEEGMGGILEIAEKNSTALLVPGDPMAATTHLQLRIEAQKRGIKTRVVCGVSVFTAVPSLLGLQHYKFG